MRALVLLAALVATAHAETIAITGATVYVRPDKKLDNATVVIRDGKIADVVVSAAPFTGAKVIDGRGKTVTAGLIEADTQIGLIEVDLEAAGNDGRFGTTPTEIHAAFRTTDAFDGRSAAIPIARTGGVTSAITGPSGGLVAGQSAWVALDGSTAPIRFPVAMQAALGPGAVAKASRGTAVEKLRELFDDADAYRRTKQNFEKNQSRKLVAERLDLEALLPVLDGRVVLVVRANSEVDIRAALAIAAERKLRLAIAGGLEAWRLAKQLAAAKVTVMIDPTNNLPADVAAIDARDDNAALLAKAGVPVAITTLQNASAARTIRQLAGVAIANGLPWDKGLAAVTTVPAQLYGIPERGTLDKNAAADVVIWSGDPFELTTRAETVIIGGVVQSLETHQTRLRDRYKTLPTKPTANTAR